MKIRPCIECPERALKIHELLFREKVKKGRKMFVYELVDNFLRVFFIFETHTPLYFFIHIVVFLFRGFHGVLLYIFSILLVVIKNIENMNSDYRKEVYQEGI